MLKSHPLLTILLLLTLAFIWIQSALPVETSSAESEAFKTEIVEPVYEAVTGQPAADDLDVRKPAHVAEYCLLSLWLTLLFTASPSSAPRRGSPWIGGAVAADPSAPQGLPLDWVVSAAIGRAVVNDMPVACQTREVPEPQRESCRRRRLRGWITPFLLALLVSFLDETIQIFSGRGPAVKDMWIDLSGAVLGLLLALLLRLLFRKRSR